MAPGLIAVIGDGLEDPVLNGLAEEAGELLAKEGFYIVNGGLGGVMRSSAKGCRKGGGTSIGLLPGLDPGEANEFIDIPVPTGLGEMRNLLIVRAAKAVIAIGGGYGTLSEIALALKLKKPVIGLKTWDISADIERAETPGQAVKLAVEAIRP